MLMAPRHPNPTGMRVSFITFWLFDRLLSVVSASALISVSCNYSFSGRVYAVKKIVYKDDWQNILRYNKILIILQR